MFLILWYNKTKRVNIEEDINRHTFLGCEIDFLDIFMDFGDNFVMVMTVLYIGKMQNKFPDYDKISVYLWFLHFILVYMV